jgi:5-bromo-4-chloroindolyl phosphate hydrolysis protein
MMRFSTFTGVFAGLVGGGLLLFMYFSVHMNPLISVLLGMAGFAGTFIVLNSIKTKTQIEIDPSSEVTQEMLDTTLNDGYDKIKVLDKYARQIKNEKVKNKIFDIIEIVKRIFENFKKDPKDVRYAKQFLAYYFDTCILIVKKYYDLSSQNARSPEIEKTLLKAENMLDSIEKAFEKQQAKLLRDDVMDLDVEIETLERTFSAEDLK